MKELTRTFVSSGSPFEPQVGFCRAVRVGNVIAVSGTAPLSLQGRTVVEEMKARGVALLSLEKKIDTSSAAGELIFHVFGAIAHFERRLIAERTKDGIAAARARGKRPGRRPLDPDKVQAALKLVEAGLAPTKAASQLGLGRSTVCREAASASISRNA